MSGATKARRATVAKWAASLPEDEAWSTMHIYAAKIAKLSKGRRVQPDEVNILRSRVSALRRRLRTIKGQGNHTGPRGKGNDE